MRPDLSLKGGYPVISSMVFFNRMPCALNVFRLDQQAHTAGQISLYGSWSRRNPVRDTVLKKNLSQG